jgi:hypothetical protein
MDSSNFSGAGMPSGSPSVVITLVHGTFALRPAWTSAGSALRAALAAAMPRERIAFQPFEWRGFLGTALNNGHRYRLAAGRRLAATLEAQCARYPDARHFVIAHSHGGNVAMYALRHPALEGRLAGLVCLGTPFIRCRPRSIERAIHTYVDIGWSAVAVPIVLLLGLFGEPAMMWLPGHTVLYEGYGIRITPLVLCLLLMLLAALALYLHAYRRSQALLSAWAQRSQQAVLERLGLPHAGPRVFCAVARGDEARRHLWWVTATGDIPYWLWLVVPYAAVGLFAATTFMAWPEYLPDVLRDPYQFTKDFAAVYWPPELANWQPRTEWDRWYDQFLTGMQPAAQAAGAALAGLGVMMVVQVCHLVVMATVPRLLRSNPLGFGQETILDNLLAVIDVTDTPETWLVDQRHYTFGNVGLRHSALYEDHQVLADVAAWIAER